MVLLKHVHEEELKCWQVVGDGDVGLAQLLQSCVSCTCSSEVHSWRGGENKKQKTVNTGSLSKKKINIQRNVWGEQIKEKSEKRERLSFLITRRSVQSLFLDVLNGVAETTKARVS